MCKTTQFTGLPASGPLWNWSTKRTPVISQLNSPIFYILLLGTLGGVVVYSFWGEIADVAILTREDGVIETISAICFLLGAVSAAVAWYRGRYVFMSVIWFILCVLFLGEETSWFQRYFDYSVPKVEAINAQGEFNIHNLRVFKTYKRPIEEVLEDFGSGKFTTLLRLAQPQFLFYFGFAVYFLIIPLAMYLGHLDWLRRWIALPPFNLSFLATLWSLIALTLVMSAAIDHADPRRHHVREIREMLLAVFIMLHIANFAFMGRRQVPSAHMHGEPSERA